MTNVTYITVLQVIEAFAAQHLQIKRFHSDFPDNIPDFSNDKEDFPILFVSPTNSIFQINTNIFQIRVYCFDLIQEGRENINSILSDTHSILSDLQVYLRDGNVPAIDLLQTSNLTPLNNALLDYAAGWYVDIQLEVSTSDLCAIPFSTPPIISDSICNSISFNSAVPSTRKLTIDGVTYDLSQDRTWVIFEGTPDQFVKGDGSYDSTIYEDTNNKQNNLAIDGLGVKFPTVDAVNFVTNEIAKATLNTGFLETIDGFSLYPFDDFTLGINGSTLGIIFKPLLDTPPFGVENAIVQLSSRIVPLSDIGLTVDGNYIKFVGYRQSDDSIIFSDTTFHQTNTTCQLGLVLVKYTGGTTSFIDPTRTTINKPDIAAYSNLEETAIGMNSSVVIAPAETNDLHIQNSDGALVGISVNWQGTNNDLLSIAANTATTFTYLAPLVPNTFPIVTTDLIDPTQYFNGTILTPLSTNTKATVQRFLLTVKGTVVVQYGEFEYANFNDAKNAIFIAHFTDILPARSAIEIGRLATRKNTTNLADDTQAYFVTTGGASGGGSTAAIVAWGQITGDITSQTDLVDYIEDQIATGTINVVAKFDTTGLTDSNIIDDGSIINLTTNALVNGRVLGSGNFNTFSNNAFGTSALINNINGFDNLAIGTQALFGLLDGDFNVGLGNQTLFNNFNGNNNVAVGNSALQHNNNDNNIAIGRNAGLQSSTLANVINLANSILIGSNTKPLTHNDINSIIIGHNLDGKGSNTVTIGNNLITDNYFNGNIRTDAFIKNGGTSNQFLKADGSVDSSIFLTNITLVGDISGTGTSPINTTLATVNTAGIYTKVLTDVKGRVLSGFNDTTIYEPTANKQNSMAIDGTGVKFPTVDAVNNQTNNIALAALNTGFLSVKDAFSLYSASTTTLGISGSSIGILFKTLLETPPFAPSTAIKQLTSRTIPLNTITLSGDGTFVKFVGYRQSDDTVVFSDNSFQSIDTICQLGLVLIQKSGVNVTFIDPERNVINKPDIAGYSNLEQTAIGLSSTVVVAPADSNDLKIKNNTGDLLGISVNWKGFNNDIVEISGNSPTTFVYIYPGLTQNFYPITEVNLIDPTKYWNGTSLVTVPAANNATVQRVLLTVNKNIVIQYGEQLYTAFQDAKNDAFIAPFTDILPAQSAIEIGRIVLRKSVTNLQTDTDALFISSGSGGGGGNGTSTAFWGAIQGDINTQTDLVNFVNFRVTGTTNFISKFDATGLTESIIRDNGISLGIATSADTTTGTTIQLGNQTDRTIAVETSTNASVIGRDLNIKAGNTTNVGGTTQGAFAGIGQTARNWYGLAQNTITKDLYGCVDNQSPYKLVGSGGTFVSLGFTPRDYRGIAINNTNGDLYVVANGGDVYKQTGGIGALNALGAGTRSWSGIYINQVNNDVYATVYTGDIYKQTGGVGAFISLAAGNRSWESICVNPNNGDVYACTSNGDIYKQTAGVGAFNALGQTTRVWVSIAVNTQTNDIYCIVNNGDLYKQTNSTGNFIAQGQASRGYQEVVIDSTNGDIFASVYGVDIFKSVIGGASDINGGTIKIRSGIGKGTGQSRIQFYTGQKLASSNVLQTETLRLLIDENGDATFSGNIIKSGGLSNQFLKANGSVDSTNYQPLQTGGIANNLVKWITSSTQATSLLKDDGFFIGMETQNPLNGDLLFGYTATQRTIGVEDSNNTFIGKDFIVKAGRSINFANLNLLALSQTTRQWTNADINYNNNDVYASTNSGDLYKQTGGVGNFVALGAGTRNWSSISVNSVNGDVYATAYAVDIFKQTGGVGAFVALSAGTRQWGGISINPANGDVYATVSAGDIYKQTGGVGAFVALGQTSRNWYDIDVNQVTGDVYAIVNGGDIYKQTGGIGTFIALSAGNRSWTGIDINHITGDVYASVLNSDIYRQLGSQNAFMPMFQSSRPWSGLGFNPVNNEMYVTVNGGDIYKQPASLGTADLNGGTLKLKSGTGKGTGSSKIQLITGQKTTSGTNMQLESVRMQIDENGYIQMFNMPTFADNASAITGGLAVGTLYKTSTGDLKIVI